MPYQKKILFSNKVLFLLIFFLCGFLFKSCKHKHNTVSEIIVLNSIDTLVDNNFQWDDLKNVFQQHYQKKYPNKIVKINAILEQQSLIEIQYYGFDNKIHKGQLVCNQKVEEDLKNIFEELFIQKFPINSVKPISEFQFEDALSMQANNTTCFDYRLKVLGNGMSKHATGMAIDINPMQNPYIHKSKVEPFPNQSDNSMGRIRNIDETEKKVIEIFKKYGWKWGGNWRSAKDYMHFEK